MNKYINEIYTVKEALLEICNGQSDLKSFHVANLDSYDLYSLSDSDFSMLSDDQSDFIIIKRTKAE